VADSRGGGAARGPLLTRNILKQVQILHLNALFLHKILKNFLSRGLQIPPLTHHPLFQNSGSTTDDDDNYVVHQTQIERASPPLPRIGFRYIEDQDHDDDSATTTTDRRSNRSRTLPRIGLRRLLGARLQLLHIILLQILLQLEIHEGQAAGVRVTKYCYNYNYNYTTTSCWTPQCNYYTNTIYY